MQAVAREFNLSETVFVLQPARRFANTARLRIFTPAIGTALCRTSDGRRSRPARAIARRRSSRLDATSRLVLEEKIGLVTCDVRGAGAVDAPRRLRSCRSLPAASRSTHLTAAAVATALGLASGRHRFRRASARAVVRAPAFPSAFVPDRRRTRRDRACEASQRRLRARLRGCRRAGEGLSLHARDGGDMTHDFPCPHVRHAASALPRIRRPARPLPPLPSVLARLSRGCATVHASHRRSNRGYEMQRPSLHHADCRRPVRRQR